MRVNQLTSAATLSGSHPTSGHKSQIPGVASLRGTTLLAIAATLGLSTNGSVGAQTPMSAIEGATILTVGDFNQDGCDDAVAWGWSRTNAVYFGKKKAPFVTRSAKAPWIYFDRLEDAPLFHGGHLYVSHHLTTGLAISVFRYNIPTSGWLLVRTVSVASSYGSQINSFRMCPFHRDVNNDKQPDVVFVWGETVGAVGTMQVGIVSPTSMVSETLAPLKNQSKDAEIVDIVPCQALTSLRNANDYQIFLSGPSNVSNSGFGTMIFAEEIDPKTNKKVFVRTSGAWAQSGPPLHISWRRSASPVAYGTFGVLPAGKTPMLQTSNGDCALFQPIFVAPFMGLYGEWLKLGSTTLLMSGCTTDYDGDGRDEIAFAHWGSTWARRSLFVGDPSSNRPYVQQFWFPTKTRPDMRVFHAATGDFDGDNDPDILISLLEQNSQTSSGHLAFLQCNRKKGKGKPALTRIY